MKKQTSVFVLLATSALLALGFGLAKHGADDPKGDPRGGGNDDPKGHARMMKTSSDNLLARHGADDPKGDPRGGHGADDPKGDPRGGGHGADDPVGHG